MSVHSYLNHVSNFATNIVYGNNEFVIPSKPRSKNHHKKEEIIRNLDTASYHFLSSGGIDAKLLTEELIFAKKCKFKFYTFNNFEKFELNSFGEYTNGEVKIDFHFNKEFISMEIILYSTSGRLRITNAIAELSTKIGNLDVSKHYKKVINTLNTIEQNYKEG